MNNYANFSFLAYQTYYQDHFIAIPNLKAYASLAILFPPYNWNTSFEQTNEVQL